MTQQPWTQTNGTNDPGNDSSVITRTRPKTQRPPLYKVLLLNDDYTPMEFVVHVLERFFGLNHSQAFEIMLTGRPVDAEEAFGFGLVTTLCEPDDLGDTALELARQITANSPYAVKHTKQVMRANLEAASLQAALELENHIQCLALGTADFKEACEAFAQKRAPVFRGV